MHRGYAFAKKKYLTFVLTIDTYRVARIQESLRRKIQEWLRRYFFFPRQGKHTTREWYFVVQMSNMIIVVKKGWYRKKKKKEEKRGEKYLSISNEHSKDINEFLRTFCFFRPEKKKKMREKPEKELMISLFLWFGAQERAFRENGRNFVRWRMRNAFSFARK